MYVFVTVLPACSISTSSYTYVCNSCNLVLLYCVCEYAMYCTFPIWYNIILTTTHAYLHILSVPQYFVNFKYMYTQLHIQVQVMHSNVNFNFLIRVLLFLFLLPNFFLLIFFIQNSFQLLKQTVLFILKSF